MADGMICPACGNENKEQAKFCVQCGAALVSALAERPSSGPIDVVPPVRKKRTGSSRPNNIQETQDTPEAKRSGCLSGCLSPGCLRGCLLWVFGGGALMGLYHAVVGETTDEQGYALGAFNVVRNLSTGERVLWGVGGAVSLIIVLAILGGDSSKQAPGGDSSKQAPTLLGICQLLGIVFVVIVVFVLIRLIWY